MRALIFGLSCLVVTATLLACSKAQPPSTSEGFDVYVPMPGDGGEGDASDATTPTDADEGGIGLGEVDRAGRPLVAVMLVPTSVQDEYDQQPTFETNLPRVLQDAIQSRIDEMDTLVLVDGGPPDPVDWPEGGALLPVVLGDTLVVDTGRSCTGADGGFVASYLDVEREAFLVGPPYVHTTCGGRTPNEDVVDEMLTLLVTGDREGGPRVTQGVAGPTQLASTTFPYLAAPN
jgi:hypothetical protein